MNNKIIVLITLLLLIIGFVLFTQRNTPEKVTKTFYKNWINYQNDSISDKLYENSKLVTNDFISYANSIKEYDPILCTQNTPKEFKIENVSIHNNEATLTVIENFDQNIESVNVSLKKIGNQWKINKITCNKEEIIPFVKANFKKQGNIIIQDNSIDLLYEEPGKPALKTKLIFDSFSTCISSNHENLNCNEINFQAGDRVEVEGFKQNDALQVYSLLILPSIMLEENNPNQT